MFRALVLSALAALSVSQSSVTVSNCAPGSFFTVDSLSFSPSAPIPGQSGTLVTSYSVPMEIGGGSTKYSCTLNGLPVYDETFDLCSQTACPIKPGAHSDKSVSMIPDTSGKVVCTIHWKDTSGSELLCIQMTMKLVKALRGAWNGGRVTVPSAHAYYGIANSTDTCLL